MELSRKITKEEWFEANGFSPDGVTYLVLGDSYSIKNELKEKEFKYSPLLRWHGPKNEFELPENCQYFKLEYQDFFYWDEDMHVSFMKQGIREVLDDIFNPVAESTSNFVGEIGERLRNIPVSVRNISGYDSPYGYKFIYTFEDNDGNLYTWSTVTQQTISLGMRVLLDGTIKAHVEYKGAFTTQLSRCKIVI